MSELPLSPFPRPAIVETPALETLGFADAEAGVCVDGVCTVPPLAENEVQPQTSEARSGLS